MKIIQIIQKNFVGTSSLLARLLCLLDIVNLVFQPVPITILRRQNHGCENRFYQKYPW